MNFTLGSETQIGGLNLQGISQAGISTCLNFPDLNLCFDVAQGLPFAMSTDHYLITHGHQDHAAGIPYVISQKALNNLKAPIFYVPSSIVEPLSKILRLWEEIEGHTYSFQFKGLKPGDEIQISSQYSVRAFETVHRVACQGYSVIQHRKKLRRDLVGLSREQIRQKSMGGETVEEWRREILLSFTGDTQIEFLDRSPEVLKSKYLFLEVTYYDERKSVQSAREWGHTHLDELIPRLKEIESEQIILVHPSRRYRVHEVKALIEQRIPDEFRDRVKLFF